MNLENGLRAAIGAVDGDAVDLAGDRKRYICAVEVVGRVLSDVMRTVMCIADVRDDRVADVHVIRYYANLASGIGGLIGRVL